jgi:hypothetical protein
LLRLRRTESALRPGTRFDVSELDDRGLALARGNPPGQALLLVAWLHQSGGVYEQRRHGPILDGDRWSLVLSTEEPRFQECPDDRSQTLALDIDLGDSLVVSFRRPSAVIVRRE